MFLSETWTYQNIMVFTTFAIKVAQHTYIRVIQVNVLIYLLCVQKKLLHLRPSTPNFMVYGELGVVPLQVAIDKRIIGYWFR